MKIQVTKFTNVHYVAQCSECDFNEAIMTRSGKTTSDVLSLVRAHVKQTGREVVVESASHRRYSAGGATRAARV